jgi:hypothetical protein
MLNNEQSAGMFVIPPFYAPLLQLNSILAVTQPLCHNMLAQSCAIPVNYIMWVGNGGDSFQTASRLGTTSDNETGECVASI